MIYSIIAYLIALVAFGIWALFNLRMDGWRKYVSAPGYTIVSALSFFCFTQSLGSPVPSWMVFNRQDISVISMYSVEGKTIYIWGFANSSEPKVIAFPWSDKDGEEIAKAQGQQKEHPGDIILEWGMPPQGSTDDNSNDFSLKFIPLYPPEKEGD